MSFFFALNATKMSVSHYPPFFLSSSLQANIKETEVTIPAKLHNSLIGSKGCLVRSIMEDCGGVHIHFPSEGSGSDKVTIRGPAGEVEKAKKQLLQLAEEKVGGSWGKEKFAVNE